MTTRRGTRYNDNYEKKRFKLTKEDYAEMTQQNDRNPLFHVAAIPFRLILNKLDIQSYVHLTRSCKTAHRVCKDTKGAQIPVTVKMIDMFVGQRNKADFLFYGIPPLRTPGMTAPDDLKKHMTVIKSLPCEVHLKRLEMDNEGNNGLLEDVRSYLKKFPIKTIREVWITHNVTNWPEIVEFLQFYNVKEVYALNDEETEVPVEVHKDLYDLNLTSLNCAARVSEDFILSGLIPSLVLWKTKVSNATATIIMNKFLASTEHVKCEFGSFFTEDGFKGFWDDKPQYQVVCRDHDHDGFDEDDDEEDVDKRPLRFISKTDEECQNDVKQKQITYHIFTEDQRMICLNRLWNDSKPVDHCIIRCSVLPKKDWPDDIREYLGIYAPPRKQMAVCHFGGRRLKRHTPY